ncbi:MAG TPA: hypothetical protein VJG65_00445 [Patescibacteria group bacterium]|nr:hypothetical protein [Patescibacteria group bacterium]
MPLWQGGEAALGYDTGFYYVMAKAIDHSGEYFPLDISREAGMEIIIPLFKLLALIGFSPEAITFTGHLVAELLLSVALYFFIRQTYNKLAAGSALVIFVISLVQLEAYSYFLYRNTLSVFFLFIAWWLIAKKSSLAFWPSLFLTIIHKSTPAIFFPVTFLYLIIKRQWKLLAVEILALVVGGVYLLTFDSTRTILNLLQTNFAIDTHSIRSGDFLELNTYLKLAWPYLVLAVGWLFYELRKKQFSATGLMFLISGTMVVTEFIFYKRLIIYLDLAAIILAGVALAYLLSRYAPKHAFAFLFGLLVIGSFVTLPYTTSRPQLIMPSELDAIKKIDGSTETSAYILNLNSMYAPWLEGWSNRKTISPGLIRDKWSYENWQIFWANNNLPAQKKLLAMYDGTPLYLFIGNFSFGFIPSTECFTRINSNLYRYDCY